MYKLLRHLRQFKDIPLRGTIQIFNTYQYYYIWNINSPFEIIIKDLNTRNKIDSCKMETYLS